MNSVVDRFIRYTGFDTRSNPDTSQTPSSEGQVVFGRMLAEELVAIGLTDVEVDWNGYVMATLPGNLDENIPVVGFISHMDTSPDCIGAQVRPRIVENYPGGDIVLHEEKNIILSASRFPEVLNYVGQSIIVTDGTTLLGADDKAGVAEIVTAMDFLIRNPDIRHGKVRVAFTPDEEIGRGADHFYVPKFGAAFAYTVDGGALGELQYENFNAASAHITLHGINVHPGSAKNKMRNSLLIAQKLLDRLPKNEVPEQTDGYQGFYHLTKFSGQVDKSELEFIIRDFDEANFVRRKKMIEELVRDLNEEYGEKVADITMRDQYYNMKSIVDNHLYVVELARQALADCGIKPRINPVRGGTDGSRLSYMGLPCPNLFTGGHNFHGEYEFIPVESMEKAVRVIVAIITKVAEKGSSLAI